MAEVPPEAEDNPEPLKYKTWVLKVSIHCEGCKRKVKRILHSVEGVYTIDIETKQHKVIVTGNVEANTLLRKLEKSGKHAELWPDHLRRPKNINNSPNDQQQPPNEEQIQNNPAVDNPDKVAVNQDQPPQQQFENPGQQPPNEAQGVVKEMRFEGNPPPPGNNPGGGGGGAKKKKKKKSGGGGGGGGGGNNNTAAVNNEVKEHQPQCNNSGPPRGESPPPLYQQGPVGLGPNPSPLNMSPRGHNRVYEYPPAYHAGPPPVYVMSYNTAYPRSYGASYYSAPPPYSYGYVHQGGDVEFSLPSDYNGMNSVQPSDTFEIFSDENPNACSVM